MKLKKDRKVILDQKDIKQALKKIAQQIISKHKSLKDIVFGIK